MHRKKCFIIIVTILFILGLTICSFAAPNKTVNKSTKGMSTLTIYYSPQYASVYLNSKLLTGKSPLIVKNLKSGTYIISVRSPEMVNDPVKGNVLRYESRKENFSIGDSEKKIISVELSQWQLSRKNIRHIEASSHEEGGGTCTCAKAGRAGIVSSYDCPCQTRTVWEPAHDEETIIPGEYCCGYYREGNPAPMPKK